MLTVRFVCSENRQASLKSVVQEGSGFGVLLLNCTNVGSYYFVPWSLMQQQQPTQKQ